MKSFNTGAGARAANAAAISATGAGVRFAAIALAAAGAVALAGCENPQPTAAPEQATAAPPAPDTALMGAPTTRTPDYVGPSEGPAGPGYPPPGAYGPGAAPPSGYAPYPPTAYPPGYGHQTGPGAPGEIVTMAPIPNPPESGWYYGRYYGAAPEHHLRHHRFWMYGGSSYAGHGWRHHHHRHAHAAMAPAPARPAPVMPKRPMPAPGQPVSPVAHHPVAHHPLAAGAAAALGGAQLLKPHAPGGRHRPVDETSAAATGGSTNAVGNDMDNQTGNVTGSEADRYKALESTLHDAFETVAVLNVPANMTPGQAATVTLTLPAEFAAAVQRDAGQQGLSDAAAGMNLLATLSGDGYTIVPTEAQTSALTAGQPVSFQWQVTPGTGAKAPLKANVRAQVVSAGQYLNLGDKTQGDNLMIGKVVGIGLLAVIAALILAWALRRKPKVAQTTVRRPAYDQYPPNNP
jgi:hypothetical protein